MSSHPHQDHGNIDASCPPPPGSVIMPTTLAKQKVSCVCKSKRCKKLTKCYESIGDIRGRFFQNPALGCERRGDIKHFKLARLCDHLGISIADDCFLESKDGRDRRGCSRHHKAGEVKGKRGRKTYIAYHHFHPEVIQEAVINQENKTVDYLHADFVMQSGLYGNGYSDEDKFEGEVKGVEGDVFVPVPSYTHAERDYELASSRFQLHGMIADCNNKFSGGSFLTRWIDEDDGIRVRVNNENKGDDDDRLKPVSKLRKLDYNNTNDLQRAICLLSSRVGELEHENKVLKGHAWPSTT